MKLSDLNKEDREFLENLVLLKNTNRIGYLSVVCMIASIAHTEQSATLSMLKDTSKGDFKRVIKCLRCAQSGYPYPETIETTIDYIRHKWLHKEVAA